MLKLVYRRLFEKEVKKAKKRGKDIEKLKVVVRKAAWRKIIASEES